jgi:hypothetical protein
VSFRPRSPALARIITVARIVRDGWVVLGLSLGLLVGLEVSYRGLTSIRAWLAGSATEMATQPDWLPAYLAEHEQSVQALVWTPYVYYRTAAFNGRYVNVDATGARRTVQAALRDDAPDIFLMGGSTLFGSFQRDAGTLPSALARHLESCEGPRPRLHNFGQSGRVFTHEVIDLLLKLRAGAKPKVVMFYDGINDVAAALQHGEPGLPINESHRVRDFELGRDLFRWETTPAAERRAFSSLVLSGTERLQLLRRMRRLIPRQSSDEPGDPVTGAAVIASYIGTARWVNALAREYGFVPVFVWQPTIHVGGKPLTAHENALLRGVEAGPYGRSLVALHRDVAAKLDETAGPALGSSFHNLVDVFNATSEEIYMDGIGHTNELANERLADVLGPVLAGAMNQNGVPLVCQSAKMPQHVSD